MEAFLDRMARSLAAIVNILDPDVMHLGRVIEYWSSLYRAPFAYLLLYISCRNANSIVKNRHGDSSGVRGAARLWDLHTFRAASERLLPRLSAACHQHH